MTDSKLFHDQEVSAGEHVRIWQSADGNLFEHVFPTGHSITIRCETLDEARSLLAQLIQDEPEINCDGRVPEPVFQGEGQEHERL
ncbi:MAG: hypothetical protein HN521_08620 [Candidatus Latescibacteria bacterium]|nr:hypothetical protein [Candidatus Latescibacterota bacterium]MBT5830621.1 hypothetical protein [Candidatus Latescibacterota bacterium]